MASEVKTNKVSAASGTTVTLGNSGDTVSLGSGATASGNDFQFNSGYGSVATAYGCRAWVNFNGTGTVAISDSGNVSSITDIDVGKYTVNFTTAMPDINYSAVGSAIGSTNASFSTFLNSNGSALTTTGFEIQNINSITDSRIDGNCICVAVFR